MAFGIRPRTICLLAVTLWSCFYFETVRGQCTEQMTFFPVSGPNVVCADGSQPGYYIDSGSTNQVIIWLGDSDLCADQADCDAKCADPKCAGFDFDDFTVTDNIEDTIDCYYANLTCGSANYPATAAGETLLCGDTGTDFETFHRVYVPQCSRDWFLGTGEIAGPSDLFHGSQILSAVLADLSGILSSATKVIWGGTRGGAIGAMNQFALIDTATPGTVLGIFDSAWIVQIAEFGVGDFSIPDEVYSYNARLNTQTVGWLANGNLDPQCVARWPNKLVNCLYASELAVDGVIPPTQEMFFFDNQYDLLTLSQNGLSDSDKASTFEDDASFASNAIRFVEQYGTLIRVSLENSNSGTSNMFHFSSACGQYGPLVPSSLELMPKTSLDIANAGAFEVSRTGSTWEGLAIAGLSLKDAVVSWISSNGVTPTLPGDGANEFGNNIRGDRCGTFLCSDSCSIEIQPVEVVNFLPDEINSLVLFIAFGVLGFGWAMFVLIYLRVRTFRFASSGKFRGEGEDPLPAFDLGAELAEMDFQRKVVALTIHNVNYWVKEREESPSPFPCDKKKLGDIQILHNVSVAALPGELHALMGPSGSGKSTVLDILSNTRNIGKISGTHAINGVPTHSAKSTYLRQWLRHNVGYVRQTDVLFPRLTLREHLIHAAWLMLPERMKNKEKMKRIWLVTRLFNLEARLDVKCGDGGVRIEGGLSGGQRRRVSVATQLLKFPAALVLDEPTSGLDSTNALLLISALRQIANVAKMNIFLTIHQPRREIFEQLHRLTILVKGRVFFSGSPVECADFFRLDTSEVNIGDDILDTLKAYEVDQQKLTERLEYYNNSDYAQNVERMIYEEASVLSRKESSALRSLLSKKARKEGRKSWNKAIGSVTSLKVLFSRTLRRGGFDVIRSGAISAFAGAVIGLVFIEAQTYTGKTALAYLMVSAATFIAFTFVGNRYKAEKLMWEHERESGTEVEWKSILVSQYVRNIVSGSVEGFCFGSGAYWVGGLNPDLERYIISITIVVLVSTVVVAQNTAVDMLLIRKGARMEDRLAILINMTLLCVGVLFNGFIVPLQNLPVYYVWTSYVLVTFWGFVGVLINNFRDFTFPCDLSKLECAALTGNNAVIRFYGYEIFDVYFCMAVLVVFLVFFKVLSTIFFYVRWVRVRASLVRVGEAPAEFGSGMGRTMRLLREDEDFDPEASEVIDFSGGGGSYPRENIEQTRRSKRNRNPFVSSGPPPTLNGGSPQRPPRNYEISMDDV